MSLTPKVTTTAATTAAAAPPTTDLTPAPQSLGGDDQTTKDLARKKNGRRALRIDPQMGGAGLSAGSTGVNIPSK